MNDELQRLSRLFAKLGARDPESWASSQMNEGIPQLGRFLFLRQAWRSIVREEDTSWIDSSVGSYERRPNAPYAGVGQALKALQAKGATAEELAALVRGVQAELLFSICYLLEDPGDLEEEVSELAWGLFLLDENGAPTEPLLGLHESVLEMDPTGNEMRPGTSIDP